MRAEVAQKGSVGACPLAFHMRVVCVFGSASPMRRPSTRANLLGAAGLLRIMHSQVCLCTPPIALAQHRRKELTRIASDIACTKIDSSNLLPVSSQCVDEESAGEPSAVMEEEAAEEEAEEAPWLPCEPPFPEGEEQWRWRVCAAKWVLQKLEAPAATRQAVCVSFASHAQVRRFRYWRRLLDRSAAFGSSPQKGRRGSLGEYTLCS